MAVFHVCWDGLEGGGRPGRVGIEKKGQSRELTVTTLEKSACSVG